VFDVDEDRALEALRLAWGAVLRAVLFAADRHRARNVTGIITGPAVTR